MPLHAIAIDDDNFALKIIEKLSEKVPCVDLKEKFNNSLDGMLYIKKHKPDLVFLDINMSDIDGLEIAEQIKDTTLIIFTTAYKEHAAQAFDLNAIDYLVKPFDFERFYQAVSKAEEFKTIKAGNPEFDENGDETIVIKADYKNHILRKADILYVEALDSYVKIHTNNEVYLTLMNLKTMEETLNSDQFQRVHKSYIVALNKIEHFSRNEIVIKERSIPVGRTYLSSFREHIN